MRTYFAAPIALLFATSALAQAPAWRISEMSGDVRIVENGRAHPAARGAVVPVGAVVATAPGARAVLVRARDYVVVSPASRVRVPTPQQEGGNGLFQMISEAGTAMFRIQHQAVPHFGVRTPYLAAVVKGTVFTVTVGARGASVQVTEGAVQVSTVDGGAADMIRPGMVATITASDLQLLHVQGETSRDIRSNGSPMAGVATVPAAEAGRYDGPAETQVAVSTTISEGPVSLADATGGLISGNLGADRAFAALDSTARTDNRGGRDGAGAGSDHGSNGQGNAGSGNNGNGNATGGGNANSGSGNNNSGGSGGGSAGSGSGNAGGGTSGSGSGNAGSGSDNSGGGNSGSGNSGSGSDNSGNGSGNSGSGNDGGDNSGSGSGHDGGSGDSGNGGDDHGSGGVNVCVAGDLLCLGVNPPRRPRS